MNIDHQSDTATITFGSNVTTIWPNAANGDYIFRDGDRALVRSTNTGISAIVDPAGRVDNRTGQWKKEILSGKVPLMQGRTVYGVMGDWLGWVCAAIFLYGVFQRITQDAPPERSRPSRDGHRIRSVALFIVYARC